jgi:hypothetical protein
VIGTWLGSCFGNSTIDAFREWMSNPRANGSGLALFVDAQSPQSLLARAGMELKLRLAPPFGPVHP